jgi:hypothetical protein
LVDGKKTGRELIDECRGEEKVKAMRQRLDAWMDMHAVNGGNSDGVECRRLGQQLWEDMEKTKFRPAQTEGAEPPNA